MIRFLVIEDNEFMVDGVTEILKHFSERIEVARTGKEAVHLLTSQQFDIAICDLKLPEMDGLEILKKTREMGLDVIFIMMTAYASVESAISAMKLGAFDYLLKPFKKNELEIVVERAIKELNLKRENEALKEVIKERDAEWVKGKSKVMQKLYELVSKVACSDATALIYGESGVGKEVVAKLLHRLSNRREKPFLCVNCAALSSGILESELFGHEKGAFTGADKTRKGRFELANGGTLLLDEISEIGVDLQAKLLRVLQEKCFERVGGNITYHTDVRIIATTNKNLERAILENKFREDLYYRLNVCPIYVPPLREHKEDIVELLNYFVEKFSKKMKRPKQIYTQAAIDKLLAYDWPGNVRELSNFVERNLIIYPDDNKIDEDKVKFELGVRRNIIPSSIYYPQYHLMKPSNNSISQHASCPDSSNLNVESLLGKPLEEVEKILIIENLKLFGGNKLKTAQALKISERTLREKLKRINEEKAEKMEEISVT